MIRRDQDTAIVDALQAEVRRIIGQSLCRVALYGSRVRDDAPSDSDYDVLIVVHDKTDVASWSEQLDDLLDRLSLEHDVVICAQVVTKSRYEGEDSPFLRSVRQEGIAL